jgi:hypothetical protein
MSVGQQVEVEAHTRRTNQKCRSCGALVTFYRCVGGKWMPFNGDPPLEVQESFLEGVARSYLPASASHFTTCPDADKWRRR